MACQVHMSSLQTIGPQQFVPQKDPGESTRLLTQGLSTHSRAFPSSKDSRGTG